MRLYIRVSVLARLRKDGYGKSHGGISSSEPRAEPRPLKALSPSVIRRHCASVQKTKVMAAMTATLAVSIKISAKSKPANARTFNMGTTLKYPDTEGREPANRGEIVIADRDRPH